MIRPSIHVIVWGHFSRNGNFIALDHCGNRIFIYQDVMKSVNFDSIAKVRFPFFAIARVETYPRMSGNPGDKGRVVMKDAHGKSVTFKRLTSRFISFSVQAVFKMYRDEISLQLESILYQKESMMTAGFFGFKPKDLQVIQCLQDGVRRYFECLDKCLSDISIPLLKRIIYPLEGYKAEDWYGVALPGFPLTTESESVENEKEAADKMAACHLISTSISKLSDVFAESILEQKTSFVDAEFFEPEVKNILESFEYLQDGVTIYFLYLRECMHHIDNSLFAELHGKRRHNKEGGMEIVVPGFACAEIENRCLKRVNIRRVNQLSDILGINIGHFGFFYSRDNMVDCLILLSELHLYRNSGMQNSHIAAPRAKQRLMSPQDFAQLSVDQNWELYVAQYYHLKVQDDFSEYLDSFELESHASFLERCRMAFDYHKLYTITPAIVENASQDDISRIHAEISSLSEKLTANGIGNVVIFPPLSNLNYKIAEIEYVPGDDKESVDIQLSDLADDEIRKMDEETGGFWRIENDLD